MSPQQALCQQFIPLRDEVQKRGMAVQTAFQHKATPQEACGLIKAFAEDESRRWSSSSSRTGSGAVSRADAIKQLKASQARTALARTNACNAAAAPSPHRCRRLAMVRHHAGAGCIQHQDRAGRRFRYPERQSHRPMSDGAGRVADASGNWVDGLARAWTGRFCGWPARTGRSGPGCCCFPAGGRPRSRPSNPARRCRTWHLVLFAIGTVAMRGAGCTWNDIVDRDMDAQVERTRSRPIPSARSNPAASGFSPCRCWSV